MYGTTKLIRMMQFTIIILIPQQYTQLFLKVEFHFVIGVVYKCVMHVTNILRLALYLPSVLQIPDSEFHSW